MGNRSSSRYSQPPPPRRSASGNSSSSAAAAGGQRGGGMAPPPPMRVQSSPVHQRQQQQPVRCPRCRRLLQPPTGHARFLCPCGQMLMAPGSQLATANGSASMGQQQQLPRQSQQRYSASNSVASGQQQQQQQPVQHVRCPACSTTLAPPPGAPVFRCPCGTHLRAPNSGSARAQVSAPPPPSAPSRGLSARSDNENSNREIDTLLGADESGSMVASMLHKRADEMWHRVQSEDRKYLLFELKMSDHHERRIFEAESKCMGEFQEYAKDLEMIELYQILENLSMDSSKCGSKEDLLEVLNRAPAKLAEEPVSTLKRRLDIVKVPHEDLLEKSEFVQRVLTFELSPFLYDLGHLRSIRPDKSLTWIPARNYVLDPSQGKCPLSAAELQDMSHQPFVKKLKWFKHQLHTLRIKWEDGRVQVKVRRSHLLSDSFFNLSKLKPEDFHRYFRFEFVGEPGIDAGGVAREWFQLVTDQVFNVDFGLFEYSGVDNVCYQINPSSGIANELHLKYFYFLGRVMGKALFDGQVIAAHMTQTLYKHLLGFPITEKDVEFVDAQIFKSMEDIRECDDVEYLYLDFTTAVRVFGEVQTVELKTNGQEIDVTNRNRDEYLSLLVKHIIFDRISPQLASLLEGFYEVIPEHLLSVFNHNELELILCGLPSIDVDDWEANTLYRHGYDVKDGKHQVIVWFWEFMRSLTEEQKARFLQFATGTSRVPVQGFSTLQGNDGNIKLFTIEPVDFQKAVFPKAHTCFNRIELPVYPDKATMQKYVLQALQMEIVGFGAE